jgi:hypothetical protein
MMIADFREVGVFVIVFFALLKKRTTIRTQPSARQDATLIGLLLARITTAHPELLTLLVQGSRRETT